MGDIARLQQEDLLTIKMTQVREEIHKRGISTPFFRDDLRPLGIIWIMSRECVRMCPQTTSAREYKWGQIYGNDL